MQMTRHRDSAFLVQSMRYTGERLKQATPENIEQLVYIRPIDTYYDRNGNKFEMTDWKRKKRLESAYMSINGFQDALLEGESFESARDLLPTGFRQDFTMSGTLENFFHWLDQRTKKDSQLETQTLAWMVLEELKDWAPEIVGWYISNRAGRANLAP
jgi:thymidylate synthase (FAD)